jgi:hypothetical protein
MQGGNRPIFHDLPQGLALALVEDARSARRFAGQETIRTFGVETDNPVPREAGRDALAGVTLASMNIPQVLGYTRIAGTPVVTGLYTVLLPLVAFAVFGSSRLLVVAADSATAAIFSSSLSHMATPASEKYMVQVGMVALLTAGFLLLARFFKLGFLADFLSRTRSPPSWAALLQKYQRGEKRGGYQGSIRPRLVITIQPPPRLSIDFTVPAPGMIAPGATSIEPRGLSTRAIPS